VSDRLNAARTRLREALEALERAAADIAADRGRATDGTEASGSAEIEALKKELSELRGRHTDLQATTRSVVVRLDDAMESIDTLLEA